MERDGDFCLTDEPGVDHALYVARHRDPVADVISALKGDLLQENRGVLNEIAGFLDAQVRRGVDPELTFEKAGGLLLRRDLEQMNGPAVELADAFVLEFVIGGRDGGGGVALRLPPGVLVGGGHLGTDGIFSPEEGVFIGDQTEKRNGTKRREEAPL